MKNIHPFYVGQKIVAIHDSKWGYFKKGAEYNVLGVKKCNCGAQMICVGFKIYTLRQVCSMCETRIGDYGGDAWHHIIYFEPIQESFQSISLSKVLEEETKLIGVN